MPCLVHQPHTITLDTLRYLRGLWAPVSRPLHPARSVLKMGGRMVSVWSALGALMSLGRAEPTSAPTLFTRLLPHLLAAVASPLAHRGSTDSLRADLVLHTAF